VKSAEVAERTQIEDRVRKEIQLEQRAKELESQLASQKSAADAAKAEAASARAEADAVIRQQAEQRVAAEQARSKQTVNTANPFNRVETTKKITPDMVDSIESASLEKFLEQRDKTRGR
jgi:peptidoglycan hydrolase CwlO-like protein